MRIIEANISSRYQLTLSPQSYVSGNGTISNDCTTTPIYQIRNGSLTAIINNTPYTYSTNPGVPYQLFVPSETPGSISTTFTLGSAGTLLWWNDQFANGQASFCSMANASIYAVFQADSIPEGCILVELTLFSTSSCAGLQLSTITGPTGR
jgi:hypothetical protein